MSGTPCAVGLEEEPLLLRSSCPHERVINSPQLIHTTQSTSNHEKRYFFQIPRLLTSFSSFEDDNGSLRVLQDWNLHLRCILQVHKLQVYILQKKLLLLLPL
ncbi:hypothetical protein PGIGA_G00224850 [Pangasianodon gigas]|uniref:Uncharacterized protein n=1 Tax=Pangasianodon gigas TaxID=30993 RepID=A0ACC5WKK1_PANGG|nr:hypothetical protein [Pangasianodon gigas]